MSVPTAIAERGLNGESRSIESMVIRQHFHRWVLQRVDL